MGDLDLYAGFDPDLHDFLLLEGYDDCIIGVVERSGQSPVVCYDKRLVLERLMQDGISREEAEEFFYYNQIGAWWGDGTPCFLNANGRGQQKGTQDG